MENKEKVYIVCCEEYWRGAEGNTPLAVYRNKEDAITLLKEEKKRFEDKNREYLNNYPDDFEITDSESYYQCLDVMGGDNFELCVIEKLLR